MHEWLPSFVLVFFLAFLFLQELSRVISEINNVREKGEEYLYKGLCSVEEMLPALGFGPFLVPVYDSLV